MREGAGQIEIWQANQQLAAHARCPGRYQVSTVAAHHAGMPWGPGARRGKNRITVRAGAPAVELRPLSVYEAVAAGGGLA